MQLNNHQVAIQFYTHIYKYTKLRRGDNSITCYLQINRYVYKFFQIKKFSNSSYPTFNFANKISNSK